jgi:hypothetical protein
LSASFKTVSEERAEAYFHLLLLAIAVATILHTLVNKLL